MAFLKKRNILFLFFLSFLTLWTRFSWSGEIKFDDIKMLVEKRNQRVKSLDSLIAGEKRKTGYLARSFIPDVKLFAGQEEFHSESLGDQSSGFYGLEVKANVFKGMSDYWEEEKREADVNLAEIQRELSLNELIFEARKSYLQLAKAKKFQLEYINSLNHLENVFKKVRQKVKGGVISNSDLISLRLVQVEFEYAIKNLAGEIAVESARLKTLLSLPSIGIEDIDVDVLSEKMEEVSRKENGKVVLVERYGAEAVALEAEGKSHLGARLPEIQLFASFGRMPFSQREFSEDADREEWTAGVQLTWAVGNVLESSRMAQSAQLRSSASKSMGNYYADEIANHINALKKKMNLLADSAQGLKKEIGLSQNYYSQISSEYLRGVKSTSDLTTVFNQLLELKKQRVQFLLQYRLARAEIEKFTGEN